MEPGGGDRDTGPPGHRRTEAVRLAARILALDVDVEVDEAALLDVVKLTRPELPHLVGVGPVNSGIVLAAWSHPGGVRNDAAWGTCRFDMAEGFAENAVLGGLKPGEHC